jgi:lysine 6-dehydrogenase
MIMKIVAFGGAGAMGRMSVRDLASRDIVEKITIADYNLEEAAVLAREIGEKCSAVRVDANNHSNMVAIASGNDVALGTIGPFYKYEEKVARACIEAGVNYVSICDDYDGADAILKLDEKAKEAGITMITGVGWTPGITNVLAKKAVDDLDEVEDIAVYWGAHASDTVGKAVTLHTMHIFAGTIPSFQRGRRVMIPAGSGWEKIRFPEPVGVVNVFHVGHPEPVTIPRVIDARNVTLKGGLVEHYFNILGKIVAGLHLTTSERGKDILGGIMNPLLPYFEKFDRPVETASAGRVDVTGKKGKEWMHRAYGAVAHMDVLTGLPASIAVQMIGENKIDAKGVMGPEIFPDPDEFLRRLKTGGIRFFEGDDMAAPLEL